MEKQGKIRGLGLKTRVLGLQEWKNEHRAGRKGEKFWLSVPTAWRS